MFNGNLSARALYEKRGFKTYASATRLEPEGQPHTLLHMELLKQRFTGQRDP